jgi:hypothetical protein
MARWPETAAGSVSTARSDMEASRDLGDPLWSWFAYKANRVCRTIRIIPEKGRCCGAKSDSLVVLRARESRAQGEAAKHKPETFNFLGFTLICGQKRAGGFQLIRRTRRDRMQATIQRVKEELRRRRHQSIPEQGKWLGQVVRGFFAYHAVSTNYQCLVVFRVRIAQLWKRALMRRSQRGRRTWKQMRDSLTTGCHDRAFYILGPSGASTLCTQGGSRVPKSGSHGSVRGALRKERPYRENSKMASAPTA